MSLVWVTLDIVHTWGSAADTLALVGTGQSHRLITSQMLAIWVVLTGDQDCAPGARDSELRLLV